jgi:hypothetical protein
VGFSLALGFVCAFECEQAKESEKGAGALMVMRYSCIHAREKGASDCSYFMFIVVMNTHALG